MYNEAERSDSPAENLHLFPPRVNVGNFPANIVAVKNPRTKQARLLFRKAPKARRRPDAKGLPSVQKRAATDEPEPCPGFNRMCVFSGEGNQADETEARLCLSESAYSP